VNGKARDRVKKRGSIEKFVLWGKGGGSKTTKTFTKNSGRLVPPFNHLKVKRKGPSAGEKRTNAPHPKGNPSVQRKILLGEEVGACCWGVNQKKGKKKRKILAWFCTLSRVVGGKSSLSKDSRGGVMLSG